MNTGHEYTSAFINRIEELAQKLPYNLMVSYFDREYDRKEYLESIIKDARELLRYNEWLVALENAIDNLCEADCRLPDDLLDLAEAAFNKAGTSSDRQSSLSMLMPDRIAIDLAVTACCMEADDIWMQGSIEIYINGEKPGTGNDIVKEDILLASMEKDGEYFIFSCSCGLPECSGWVKGIRVQNLYDSIQWTNLNTGKSWYFNTLTVKSALDSIKEEATIYKDFFGKKGIEYVGVGVNWYI